MAWLHRYVSFLQGSPPRFCSIKNDRAAQIFWTDNLLKRWNALRLSID